MWILVWWARANKLNFFNHKHMPGIGYLRKEAKEAKHEAKETKSQEKVEHKPFYIKLLGKGKK